MTPLEALGAFVLLLAVVRLCWLVVHPPVHSAARWHAVADRLVLPAPAHLSAQALEPGDRS